MNNTKRKITSNIVLTLATCLTLVTPILRQTQGVTLAVGAASSSAARSQSSDLSSISAAAHRLGAKLKSQPPLVSAMVQVWPPSVV